MIVLGILMLIPLMYMYYPIWYRRTLRKRSEQQRLKAVKFFNID